jgi:AraC-like DNA-binding protein
VRYFDDKKPYLNATFSVSSLADALNSNSTYISQAIKVHKKVNFNSFVNMYRVKKAIELMQEDDEKKYTLQYIHQEAGFQSQTTFNRVFKQITGFTPPEIAGMRSGRGG